MARFACQKWHRRFYIFEKKKKKFEKFDWTILYNGELKEPVDNNSRDVSQMSILVFFEN